MRTGTASLNSGCPSQYAQVEYTGVHYNVCQQLCTMQDQLIQQGLYNMTLACSTIDWRKGYNQLPYRYKNNIRFGIVYDDTILEPNYVIFGHSPGGRYCQAVNEAVCIYAQDLLSQWKHTSTFYDMIRNDIKYFWCYVDDDIALGYNIYDTKIKHKCLTQAAAQFGVQLADDKSEHGHIITWLGNEINCYNNTIDVTIERKAKLVYFAINLHNNSTLGRWHSIHGVMQSVAWIRYPLKIYCKQISDMIQHYTARGYSLYQKIKPFKHCIQLLFQFITILFDSQPCKWENILEYQSTLV